MSGNRLSHIHIATVCAIETVTLSFRLNGVRYLTVRRSISVLLTREGNYFVGRVLLTCQILKANSFASIG